jgi:L-lysine 2,3-aminomutase
MHLGSSVSTAPVYLKKKGNKKFKILFVKGIKSWDKQYSEISGASVSTVRIETKEEKKERHRNKTTFSIQSHVQVHDRHMTML